MRIILFYFLVLLAYKTSAGVFVLEGRIEGMSEGRLYLNYLPGEGRMGIIDSCEVRNGSFEFKGAIAEPCLATLSTFNLFVPGYVYNEKNISGFYLEAGRIAVRVILNQFGNMKVEGSETEKDRVALERLKAPLEEKKRLVAEPLRNEYNAWLRRQDSTRMEPRPRELDSLQSIVDDLQKQEWEIDSLFVIQHPRSYVAADILSWNRYEDIAFPSLEALYTRFPRWIRASRPGQRIREEIEKEKVVYVGKASYSFTALTSRGDTFRLDSYRGRKYVLLDFWASWCAPCRQITPLLQKWYRLHPGELEIVSISLNDKEDDWRKAISADKMEWPQINGDSKLYVMEPPEGSIPGLYHVNLLPSLILLDKDLKVLAIFGGWYRAKSTNELEKELRNLFNH